MSTSYDCLNLISGSQERDQLLLRPALKSRRLFRGWKQSRVSETRRKNSTDSQVSHMVAAPGFQQQQFGIMFRLNRYLKLERFHPESTRDRRPETSLNLTVTERWKMRPVFPVFRRPWY